MTAGSSPTAPRSAEGDGADAGKGPRLGLVTATTLVIGNVVGTGIFLLPANMARYGTVSILALGAVSIGALAIAMVFGRLGARVPASGGPYAYAREAFGEFAGFWNAWSFWITAWAGNAGIAVAWVGYVNVFVPWDNPFGKTVLALVGLWIPAVVNLSGVRNIGRFQLVTTVLKFVPLVFVGLVGLLFIDPGNFGPFIGAADVTGGSFVSAFSLAGAVLLFAYSGVESVAVVGERVEDPARNIGRASVYGTLAVTLVYLLGTVAVMGNVPHDELVNSEAPFALAVDNMFGGEVWGYLFAVMAIISGIGALNGWTMLVAEMPMAAARDGLFPTAFATTNRRGAPSVAIVIGTLLTSAVAALNYFYSEDAFETILLLATFTSVLPYFFSAAAQLYWLVTRGRDVVAAHLARDVTVAVVALLFSLWLVFGSGPEAVLQGMLIMLLGVPVYIWAKAGRGEYGPGEGRSGRPPVSGERS
ncbi:amino acid/polyamine/organocation transporter (APC superfamily) [Murinocardiopsis flavida]|uniref:Amino acid/polyamine/organocation transporter (APC superfamily) n=1 Tax=Murinocardiopsis flavida TaxID=645275 RepID=A0A2P8DHP6_9ACTN|nr:amino acid permease [Murinocardiopsis flavida]PSK96747.1 amino acid/polyamine/organocation transporter (APC superfamily) [Murinocardiopsis flavida]